MGFWDSMKQFLNGKAYPSSKTPAATSTPMPDSHRRMRRPVERILQGQTLTQAYGVDEGDPDYDDSLFKRVENTDTTIDLSPEMLKRLQTLSLVMYRKNGRAFTTIENTVDFAYGEGLTIVAEHPQTQTLLDNFWALNDWPVHAKERLRAFCLFGEQVWPVFTSPTTDVLGITSLSPFKIADIERAEHNASLVSALLLEAKTGQPKPRLSVIHPRFDPSILVGNGSEAFFFTLNRPDGGARGQPDLSSSIDWLEGMEDFTFSVLERTALGLDVVFDLQVDGETNDTNLQAYADRFMRSLKSGTAFAHNERLNLNVKSPDLGASDVLNIYSVLSRQISSGTRQPCTFYSDAGDLSRSSATELTTAVSKFLTSRQAQFNQMFCQLFDLQIAFAKYRNPGLWASIDTSYYISLPKIQLKDFRTMARAVKDIVDTAIVAVEKGLLDPEQAKEIIASAFDDVTLVPND
jgi:hypothetical protein